MPRCPSNPTPPASKDPRTQSTLSRVVQYTGLRMIAMFITIMIGVYLTIYHRQYGWACR